MTHRFYILRKIAGSVIALTLAIIGGIIYHQNALAAPQVNYFLIDGAKTTATSPYEVTAGATPTLSWEVTDFGSSTSGTLSCQASDHWSGSKTGAGTETRPATDTSQPGDYTYILTCKSLNGALGQTSSSVYLHVVAPPAVASPTTSTPPPQPTNTTQQELKSNTSTATPSTKNNPAPITTSTPVQTSTTAKDPAPLRPQIQTNHTTSRAEIVNTIVNWIFWLLVILGLLILTINLFFPTFFRILKRSLLGLWWAIRLPFRSKKLPVTNRKKTKRTGKKRR